MGRHVLEVKGYAPEQIKALFRAENKYIIGIRLYAVYQVSLGKPSRTLEELYNTSFKQITNWVHQFEKDGIDGLRDKPGRGRKSQLSDEQLEELKQVLLHDPPDTKGFNTSTWSWPILREYIKKQYDINYKKAQIYNILKSIGLTYQKGKASYPEADEAARQEFIGELKKTTSGSWGNSNPV
jgi:transposase